MLIAAWSTTEEHELVLLSMSTAGLRLSLSQGEYPSSEIPGITSV